MKKTVNWETLKDMVEDIRATSYELERAVEQKNRDDAEELRDNLAGQVDQMYYMFNEED